MHGPPCTSVFSVDLHALIWAILQFLTRHTASGTVVCDVSWITTDRGFRFTGALTDGTGGRDT